MQYHFTRKSLLLLVFLPILHSAFQFTEIQWETKGFHAAFQSTQPFEVELNPIPIVLYFSEPPQQMDESFILTSNCIISSFTKVSDVEYHFQATILQPGSVSVTLSKYIQSTSLHSMNSIPTLPFYYHGISILSQSITKLSSSSCRFELISSKPATFFSYVSTKSLSPSFQSIQTHGSTLIHLTDTIYSLELSSLQPGQTYYIYSVGQEECGTPTEQQVYSFTTPTQLTKTICPKAWIINTKKLVEMSECSNHGVCEENQCKCDSGFKGQACEEIETISFKQPSIETSLIHSYFILSIESYYSNDLSLFIQNSIHEAFATYCAIPLSELQIYQYSLLQSHLPSLSSLHIFKTSNEMNQNTSRSIIHIHFSLSTEKINSNLYKALLENEEIEMEMKSFLELKGISLLSLERKKVAIQEQEDSWYCYNGMKDKDESDVDCGGKCIQKCSINQSCENSFDCETGLACKKTICKRQASFTIPVLGCCCIVLCMLLIIGTFIKHNTSNNHPTPSFEQLKNSNV